MVRKFFYNLRGVLFFTLLTINTIVCVVPIILFALLKLLVPIPAVRRTTTRWLMATGELWVAINAVLLRTAASLSFEVSGIDNLRHDGWYLVIANHQTWVDILVLQVALNRRIPFLKFFIKQELIWFPLLGFAWWGDGYAVYEALLLVVSCQEPAHERQRPRDHA